MGKGIDKMNTRVLAVLVVFALCGTLFAQNRFGNRVNTVKDKLQGSLRDRINAIRGNRTRQNNNRRSVNLLEEQQERRNNFTNILRKERELVRRFVVNKTQQGRNQTRKAVESVREFLRNTKNNTARVAIQNLINRARELKRGIENTVSNSTLRAELRKKLENVRENIRQTIQNARKNIQLLTPPPTRDQLRHSSNEWVREANQRHYYYGNPNQKRKLAYLVETSQDKRQERRDRAINTFVRAFGGLPGKDYDVRKAREQRAAKNANKK
eukprot:TRINITY_DN4115_c0_g1_i4.p1 TRINITY_DN4115_c0_g1~~TRINITY_DN4115_c0_g1_i4.p1  ORF type:complete len:269 (+),score=90.22 TRINITY_DN4115_c0_g1_i4:235-1041(+)